MKKKLLVYVIVLLVAVFLMFLLKPVNFESDLNNSIDLVLPTNDQTKSQNNFTVFIDSEGNYTINDSVIAKDSLEGVLINKIKSEGYDGVQVRSHQDSEMKHLLFVMDIANRNKLKIIVGVISE